MITRMSGVTCLMLACFLSGTNGIAQEQKPRAPATPPGQRCLQDCVYNHGGCVAVAKRFTPPNKRAVDLHLCERTYNSCMQACSRRR
jgi:hypothetical protein